MWVTWQAWEQTFTSLIVALFCLRLLWVPSAFIYSGDTVMQYKAVIAPMIVAAVGILLSILGIFAVRAKEDSDVKGLLNSLSMGTNLSSVLIAVATFAVLWLLQIDNWIYIGCSVVVGTPCRSSDRQIDGILYVTVLQSYSQIE